MVLSGLTARLGSNCATVRDRGEKGACLLFDVINLGLDRRGGGRIRHITEVLVRGLSSTFQRGSSRDFTEDGARLVVPEAIGPGHSLMLYLRLEAKRALSLLGTVVWARPAEHGTEVGVRFQAGCAADRQRFCNWLHTRRLLAFC